MNIRKPSLPKRAFSITKFAVKTLLCLVLLLSIFNVFTISKSNLVFASKLTVLAQDNIASPEDNNYLGKNFGCSIATADLSITNLLAPAEFLPVIPENCSSVDGQPIPLSPVLIPAIIARLFGLIASSIFYLLLFVVIVSGIMWTWGGIDNKNISQAKQNFKDAGVAVLMLISTYVILSTIIGLLSPNQVDTNINNLFYNRTKI